MVLQKGPQEDPCRDRTVLYVDCRGTQTHACDKIAQMSTHTHAEMNTSKNGETDKITGFYQC